MNEVVLEHMSTKELIAYIDKLESIIETQFAIIHAHEQTEDRYLTLLDNDRYFHEQGNRLRDLYRCKTDFSTNMINKYVHRTSEPDDVEDALDV